MTIKFPYSKNTWQPIAASSNIWKRSDLKELWILFRYSIPGSIPGSNSGHTDTQPNVLLYFLVVWVYSRVFPYIMLWDTEKAHVWMRGAIGILYTKTKT